MATAADNRRGIVAMLSAMAKQPACAAASPSVKSRTASYCVGMTSTPSIETKPQRPEESRTAARSSENAHAVEYTGSMTTRPSSVRKPSRGT